MMRPVQLILLCVALSLCPLRAAAGVDLTPTAGGVRGAFSATSIDTGFVQVDGFAQWKLRWRWEAKSHWYCDTALEASAGALTQSGDTGFVGTVGPLLKIGRRDWPVYLDLGTGPTVLSRHHFGGNNFGGDFQFTSHGGVGLKLSERFELGYRFQHMSNSGIYHPNPGLNLHSFGISLRF